MTGTKGHRINSDSEMTYTVRTNSWIAGSRISRIVVALDIEHVVKEMAQSL